MNPNEVSNKARTSDSAKIKLKTTPTKETATISLNHFLPSLSSSLVTFARKIPKGIPLNTTSTNNQD